jgi:hypothetical protein
VLVSDAYIFPIVSIVLIVVVFFGGTFPLSHLRLSAVSFLLPLRRRRLFGGFPLFFHPSFSHPR